MKIEINGKFYDFIDVSTMTLDEAGWFYEIADAGPEALGQLEAEGFKPKLIKAWLCLSISRAEPEVKPQEIEAVVGKLGLLELGEAFEKAVAESPPDDQPASETGDETPPSGDASSNAGAPYPVDVSLSSIGSPGSATGSGYVRRTSAG